MKDFTPGLWRFFGILIKKKEKVIELKREKLVLRVEEARKNFEKGLVKSGTIKELLEDLESD